MVSPISPRAREYVRSRATAVMEYYCRIERVTKGNHDEDTLVYTPGSRTTIYQGYCRIWELSGTSGVQVGDADLDIQMTQLSTPWNAPLARKDDEVYIIEAPTQDKAMEGRRFQITSSAKAGELRATRRYAVKAWERTP